MTIVIGTKTDQFELAGVEWIILDKLDLEIHTDGKMAVIEEVKKDEEDFIKMFCD